VTFNGAAATARSWGPQVIVVTVPSTATTGDVVVTVGGVASNRVTFTIQTYTISGIVTVSGCPLPNATVTLSGSATASTLTDTQGAYRLTAAGGGTYTVTASATNYTFPAGQQLANLSSDQANINFAATSGPALLSREYIRLGGRIIAITNCRSQ